MEAREMAVDARQTQPDPDVEDANTDIGHEMTREEVREFFDERARAWLGMSGEDFIRAWDAGEFDDDPDRTEVMAVASLLGFGRFGR